jgi:hypothetical protein
LGFCWNYVKRHAANIYTLCDTVKSSVLIISPRRNTLWLPNDEVINDSNQKNEKHKNPRIGLC